MTIFVQGLDVGSMVLTAATVTSVVGCLLIGFKRVREERPILSLKLFAQPAALFTLAYFAVGIGSGIFAEDQERYLREIVQRSIIILCPLYLYVFGPSHPRVLLRALVCYLPVCGVLALAIAGLALRSGMDAPIFLFGMHKNAGGADCSHLVVISFALLLSKQFPKQRFLIAAVMVLGILGIVGAQARAALIGVIIGSFLMMLANRNKVRHLLVAVVVLVFGLGAMVTTLPKETIDHALSTEKHSGNAIRQETWALISEKLRNDPLMCVGWGNRVFSYLDVSAPGGFATSHGIIAPDCANIFFYDWAQMSVLGVVAQIAMFTSCLVLPFSNARRCLPGSPLSAINLAALGIMATRVEQAYLDSFWVGRGPTLAMFVAVGMALFVRLWLNQSEEMRERSRLSNENAIESTARLSAR